MVTGWLDVCFRDQGFLRTAGTCVTVHLLMDEVCTLQPLPEISTVQAASYMAVTAAAAAAAGSVTAAAAQRLLHQQECIMYSPTIVRGRVGW